MYSNPQNIKKAFAQLNLFFEKVFVVSLEDAPDRHDFIAKSLDGLAYEIIYGVDKRKVSDDFLLAHYDDKLTRKHKYDGRSIRLSEVAISLSHRKVYQHIVDHKISNALILEDDAFLIEEHLLHLKSILKELPADWDCIYFGYIKNEKKTLRNRCNILIYLLLRTFGAYKLDKNQIRNRFPRAYSQHLRYVGMHDCIHALAVTNKAAEQLIQNQTPVQYAADTLVASLSGKGILKSFIAVPKIFDQASHKPVTNRVKIESLNKYD